MMKVRCFYTFSGSKIAKLARWATNGPWGHMGISFEKDDGSIDCFEARSDEGFVGPFPVQQTAAYVDERGGYFEISKPLDLSTAAVASIHAGTRRMVGNVTYSKMQLGLMFLAERYGIRLPPSPNKVVCSEAVARLLDPHVDLRDCDHSTFDVVSPNSAYWRMCEIQARYNSGRVRDNEEK